MTDWDDGYDDDAYGDDFYGGDEYGDDAYGDEPETVACSHCGADVYEDAPACPVCGEYLVAGGRVGAGMPGWFVVLGIIGTVITMAVLAIG